MLLSKLKAATAIVTIGLAWGIGFTVQEVVVAQSVLAEKDPTNKGLSPVPKGKDADPKIEKRGVADDTGAKPGDGTIRPIHSLRGHTNRINSVAYSPDGASIATASGDGTARIWDAKTAKELMWLEFPGTNEYLSVGQIAFSADNAFVVTRVRESRDVWVIVAWDRRTGEKVRTFPTGVAGGFALSPDGRLVACAEYGLARLYELATGKIVREMSKEEQPIGIATLAFSTDGKTLVATGRPATPQRDDGVDRLTIMPDVIRFWDVATGKLFPSALKGLVVGSLGQHIGVSPDGRTIIHASQYTDKNRYDITVRETSTGGLRGKLTGHKGELCDLAFLPDGRTLASASDDGTVRLWDLPSGKQLGCLGKEVDPFKGGWILAVAFSPDGRTLVSGGLDKRLHFWDVSKITDRRRISDERSPADLEADWMDLAGDAATAYAAIGRSVSSSEPTTVAFLGKRLQSAKAPDLKRIEQMIRNLNDNQFQVREQSRKELEELGELAGPSLETALALNPPLEIKRRLDALLERLARMSPSTETTRQVRAVEALEFIATPEARKLLETLASSTPETRMTREAKASVDRLTKRGKVAP